MLFPMGRLLATPGVLETVSRDEIFIALGRHLKGDWGDVSSTDKCSNNESIKDGSRLLSVYHAQDDLTFWIITEADRSATTVPLPSEY